MECFSFESGKSEQASSDLDNLMSTVFTQKPATLLEQVSSTASDILDQATDYSVEVEDWIVTHLPRQLELLDS